MEKVFLEISQNSQKNACARVSFLIKLQAMPGVSFLRKLQAGLQLYLKKTLALVFSCEFSEIYKKTPSYEHLRWLLVPDMVLRNRAK